MSSLKHAQKQKEISVPMSMQDKPVYFELYLFVTSASFYFVAMEKKKGEQIQHSQKQSSVSGQTLGLHIKWGHSFPFGF